MSENRQLSADGFYDLIRSLPNVRSILENHYGSRQRLDEELEKMGDDADREARLFAQVQAQRLVTEARRRDLLERYPARKQLNDQLAGHRIQARREILHERLGADLNLRMRQTGNELAAAALRDRFFLHSNYSKNLDGLLEKVYGKGYALFVGPDPSAPYRSKTGVLPIPAGKGAAGRLLLFYGITGEIVFGSEISYDGTWAGLPSNLSEITASA